jgi:DNA-binding response OmpR family regulator
MSAALRILVVDDDADILRLLGGALTCRGVATKTARNAAQADTALENFPADLIVLDLMMEGEDGRSFCKRLRLRSNVPIIMLTALAEDVDRIVGLEIGADDYLPKLFNPRELVARIKSVLRRARDGVPVAESDGAGAFTFGLFRLVASADMVRPQGPGAGAAHLG